MADVSEPRSPGHRREVGDGLESAGAIGNARSTASRFLPRSTAKRLERDFALGRPERARRAGAQLSKRRLRVVDSSGEHRLRQRVAHALAVDPGTRVKDVGTLHLEVQGEFVTLIRLRLRVEGESMPERPQASAERPKGSAIPAHITRIKGLAFAHLEEFIVSQHGEAGMQRVLARLSPETGKILRSWNASQWYPMQNVVDIDLAVVNALYGGDVKQAYFIGRFDLDRSVRQVYRLLFRFLEPTFLLKRSAKLWSNYYDRGALTIEQTQERLVLIRLSDFDPVQGCLCQVFMGAFAGALEACRARGVTITHPECVLEGARTCLFKASWLGTDSKA